MNRLITKSIYIEVYEVCLQVSFWGAPTHADIIEFSNFLLQLKIQRPGSKNECDFSMYYFNFEKNYDVGTINK